MLDFESALESFAICTTPFLSGIARLGVSNWGRILDLLGARSSKKYFVGARMFLGVGSRAIERARSR